MLKRRSLRILAIKSLFSQPPRSFQRRSRVKSIHSYFLEQIFSKFGYFSAYVMKTVSSSGLLIGPLSRRLTSSSSNSTNDNDILVLSTPNPNAMKFIPGCDVTENASATLTLKKGSAAPNRADPLSELLLRLDGVSAVNTSHIINCLP